MAAISKSRLMYILALIIALSVLVWDRTRPTPDSAEETPSASSPVISQSQPVIPNSMSGRNITLPPTVKPYNQTTTDVQQPSLVKRLITGFSGLKPSAFAADAQEKLSSQSVGERDLFSPGRPFKISSQTNMPPKPTLPPLCLQSTLIQPGNNRAMLNGQVVAEGDKLGDITIIRIESDNVIVSFEEQVVRIMLDVTPPDNPQIHPASENPAKQPSFSADADNSTAEQN